MARSGHSDNEVGGSANLAGPRERVFAAGRDFGQVRILQAPGGVIHARQPLRATAYDSAREHDHTPGRKRLVLASMLSLVALAGCGSVRETRHVGDADSDADTDWGVGDPCRPRRVPEGGFRSMAAYLDRTDVCPADACIVNHYSGDLIDSPVEGDGIPEPETCENPEREGWACVTGRIYCTCKCGVSDGGDPDSITCPSCPDGFVCCPMGEGAGDYCVREGTCEEPWHEEPGAVDEVDLLVMVDDSSSMSEEQRALTLAMPDVFRELLDPADEDGDGEPDHAAASSLHVGVISSDMGTGGEPVESCEGPALGDDGVLQRTPSPDVDGCDAAYPAFLTSDVDDPDPGIDQDFECIATLGTDGCELEQQLYAVAKALTVHSAPGAANCEDPEHGNCFLRNDALLAILVVTDEDDCSVADPRLFGDGGLGPLGIRCFSNPAMVRPVDELVESILDVKLGRPDRMVIAGIVGVPRDLVALSEDDLRSDDIMTTHYFDDILDDSRMLEAVDHSPEGGGNRLVPSCDVPGLGMAFPPRRIVELVQRIDEVGNNGIVQSICQADWTPVMRAVTRLIQSKLGGPECGNGIIEEGELCDGDAFPPGDGSCEDWGLIGGPLSCRQGCRPGFFGCAFGD